MNPMGIGFGAVVAYKCGAKHRKSDVVGVFCTVIVPNIEVGEPFTVRHGAFIC